MTLRVKLEIVPFGEEDKAYEIGRLDIFNKGDAGNSQCEYGVIEFDTENNQAGMYAATVLHRRDQGPWVLVRKVLSFLVT